MIELEILAQYSLYSIVKLIMLDRIRNIAQYSLFIPTGMADTINQLIKYIFLYTFWGFSSFINCRAERAFSPLYFLAFWQYFLWLYINLIWCKDLCGSTQGLAVLLWVYRPQFSPPFFLFSTPIYPHRATLVLTPSFHIFYSYFSS